MTLVRVYAGIVHPSSGHPTIANEPTAHPYPPDILDSISLVGLPMKGAHDTYDSVTRQLLQSEEPIGYIVASGRGPVSGHLIIVAAVHKDRLSFADREHLGLLGLSIAGRARRVYDDATGEFVRFEHERVPEDVAFVARNGDDEPGRGVLSRVFLTSVMDTARVERAAPDLLKLVDARVVAYTRGNVWTNTNAPRVTIPLDQGTLKLSALSADCF